MARRRSKPHYFLNLGLSVVVLGIFSVLGVRVFDITSAATSNPYGFADYCELENNATVIYGWAADPNATALTDPSVTVKVGTQSVTVSTNRAGFRDAGIHKWIDLKRTGDPKPGTYGYRAVFNGLYKGTVYPISGTVINIGVGTNTILGINSTHSVDGSTKPFFAKNEIPEACLATLPATPVNPPPSTPPPNPPTASSPPAAVTQPRQTSKLTATRPPTTSSTTVISQSAPVADPVVTTGTLAAQLNIAVGNAKKIKVSYGKNPLQLNRTTPERAVAGTETVIMLTNLDPSSTYAYQVLRIDAAGKATTSPTNTFETFGFIVAIHFTDGSSEAIQGIPARLSTDRINRTSDEEGNVQFFNVPAGDHIATYTYKQIEYTKRITISASSVKPEETASSQVITKDFTINIEKELASQMVLSKNDDGNSGILITAVLSLISITLIVSGILLRRRKMNSEYASADMPPPPLPEYVPLLPPTPNTHPVGADHMGESLKDMVIRTMTEEAKRRNNKK